MPTDTITRPNGKTYRPRKPGLVAHCWEDEFHGEAGVIVFGTLDEGDATETALAAVRRYYGCNGVTDAYSGWFRDGYRYGERAWISDTEHGRPGVHFTAVDL